MFKKETKCLNLQQSSGTFQFPCKNLWTTEPLQNDSAVYEGFKMLRNLVLFLEDACSWRFCWSVFGVQRWFSPVTSSSSSTLGHTQVLTLFLRCEAVFVAVTAAVPEARAFVLFGVIEPDHGVVLAAALVLFEEAGIWKETGHTEYRFILIDTCHDNTSLKVQ